MLGYPCNIQQHSSTYVCLLTTTEGRRPVIVATLFDVSRLQLSLEVYLSLADPLQPCLAGQILRPAAVAELL